MANKIPRRVDFDRIAWLLEMFNIECKSLSKLYHITRVVIDPSQGEADDFTEGWDEFRPGETFFGHASYDQGLTSRQHVAYHGEAQRLLDYTGLAAKGFMDLPGVFNVMASADRDAAFDRDAWTWGLYRIALSAPGILPLDMQGNGKYAQTEPQNYKWLKSAIVDDLGSSDRGRQNVLDWQAQVGEGRGFVPRYVYGCLALDVFASSACALDYILKNAESFYFPAKTLPFDGPAYYAEKVQYHSSRESATKFHLRVDFEANCVKVGLRSYGVGQEEALFFQMLRDAGGNWVSGPEMIEKMKREGIPNYRPDRVLKNLLILQR